ncbi:MAG: AGE family epimerase/isomerase [Chloroflexota bacterium]
MGRLQDYQQQVLRELREVILPFYPRHAVDRERGGFYGWVGNDGRVDKQAPRSLIQHTRLLWTFALAARVLDDSSYRELANHAYEYLLGSFWDGEFGGFYWMLDYKGQPIETDKLTYGQAFAIYALAEYALLTEVGAPLAYATSVWKRLEVRLTDQEYGGYFEGARRDWSPAPELHVDDHPTEKGMNSHLHLLEAYTNLLRAWDDERMRESLGGLLRVVLDRVVDERRAHLKLYMDKRWEPLSDHVSYGHDIEASWLLYEAAEVLGEVALLAECRAAALSLAEETLAHGLDDAGAVINSDDVNLIGADSRDWWPQAEGMVGFLNAYQISGEGRFLDASLGCWEYARTHLSDREHGEWFSAVDGEGRPFDQPKTGPWKTPYHNGRACLEVYWRVEAILANSRRSF